MSRAHSHHSAAAAAAAGSSVLPTHTGSSYHSQDEGSQLAATAAHSSAPSQTLGLLSLGTSTAVVSISFRQPPMGDHVVQLVVQGRLWQGQVENSRLDRLTATYGCRANELDHVLQAAVLRARRHVQRGLPSDAAAEKTTDHDSDATPAAIETQHSLPARLQLKLLDRQGSYELQWCHEDQPLLACRLTATSSQRSAAARAGLLNVLIESMATARRQRNRAQQRLEQSQQRFRTAEQQLKTAVEAALLKERRTLSLAATLLETKRQRLDTLRAAEEAEKEKTKAERGGRAAGAGLEDDSDDDGNEAGNDDAAATDAETGESEAEEEKMTTERATPGTTPRSQRRRHRDILQRHRMERRISDELEFVQSWTESQNTASASQTAPTAARATGASPKRRARHRSRQHGLGRENLAVGGTFELMVPADTAAAEAEGDSGGGATLSRRLSPKRSAVPQLHIMVDDEDPDGGAELREDREGRRKIKQEPDVAARAASGRGSRPVKVEEPELDLDADAAGRRRQSAATGAPAAAAGLAAGAPVAKRSKIADGDADLDGEEATLVSPRLTVPSRQGRRLRHRPTVQRSVSDLSTRSANVSGEGGLGIRNGGW